MRILLVEDDELLGDGIVEGLKQYDHTVDWVRDGKSAQDVLLGKNEIFDAIILDIGLPKISGLDVLKTIRDHRVSTPVLLLTARETVDDRVKGLDAGADDYLTKPFDLDELCARLRAIQRRSKSRPTSKITHSGIVLDPTTHVIEYQNEKIILTRKEHVLLLKLLENVGRVISREQLTQTLYGWGENIDSNALEVHIHNLRKRFGQDLIRTIRGVGYMVEEAEDSV